MKTMFLSQQSQSRVKPKEKKSYEKCMGHQGNESINILLNS